jgi:hypothetical protein
MIRRSFPLVLVLALLGAAPSGWAVDEPDDPPMTEEDVVRLYVAGRSAAEIVHEIERREPGYDVSPEMLEELRNVELPRAVIEAMIRRQRQADRLEAERRAAAGGEGGSSLRLRMNPAADGRPVTVGLRARIDPQLAAEMELGNAPDERVFADLALFLACFTADHVPDQWRLKSPLGRDFHRARRHRLLEFVAGARGEQDSGQGRRVKLEIPTHLELALEPGVAHDLLLGLAVRVGGNYRIVALDEWPGVVLGDDGLELRARVKGGSFRKLKVRFLREGEEDEDDEADEDEDRDERLP